LLTTLLASALITVTTIIGFRAINWLATLLVPLLLVICGLLLGATLSAEGEALAREPTITWGQGVSAIVGSIIIGAIIMPDITRFLRRPGGAVWVTSASYLVIQPSVMIIAALASLSLMSDDIIGLMVSVGLGIAAFAIVIASSWILNALNLYSAVLGLTASYDRLPATPTIVALGAIGVVAAILNILDSFLSFLFYLSVIFIPVAGVVAIDWLLLRRNRYAVTTVAAGQPTNVPGLVAWLTGALLALLADAGVLPSVTQIATVDAILVSAIIYWSLARVWKAKP
jgi:cytosine permease